MSITSGFLPINPVSTFAQVDTALSNLQTNIAKVNSYGHGTQSPFLTPIHPTSSTTVDTTANTQWQGVGVRSSVSAITITLPTYSNLINGSLFVIYDETFNANTYNITIERNGNLINNAASNKTINAASGYIWLYCFSVGLTRAEFIILGSSGVV